MKIGIVGAGLIGKKRAASLNDSDKLYYVCDINKPQAKSLAKQYSAYPPNRVKATTRFPSLRSLDWVPICSMVPTTS